MTSIRNIHWALGLGLFTRNKALPLGTLLAGIGLMLFSGVATADLMDTFDTQIDPGVWTTSISTNDNGGAGVGTVAWDSGHVEITQSTTLYANIRTSIGPGVKSVSADINNVSDDAISWSPSVALYFDPTHWLEFNVSTTDGFLVQSDTSPAGPQGSLTGVSSASNTWYTLEIKLNPTTDEAEFYEGPQGGPLTHLVSGDIPVPPSFFTDSAYVILGKGYNYTQDPSVSYLDRDYIAPGTAGGVSLFDNVVVVTPEPASLGLLVLGGTMLLRRRR